MYITQYDVAGVYRRVSLPVFSYLQTINILISMIVFALKQKKNRELSEWIREYSAYIAHTGNNEPMFMRTYINNVNV